MIISPEPLHACITDIFGRVGSRILVFYVTPRGYLWSQQKAQELSYQLEEFILICGHYEGIDERIIDIFDIQQISIGEYVLTS
jgi:tRNA (guanine37-N1)-methyltransferase